MKKSVLVSLTVAALSVAASPLALAQSAPVESTSPSYLTTRLNMDSPAAISQALQRVHAEQRQADLNKGGSARDFAAGYENIDGLNNFNAIYQQVAENRALVGTGSETGHDYLAERKSQDSLQHINQIVNQGVKEEVSAL